MANYATIQHCLYPEPIPDLKMNKSHLYDTLGSYHYDEILKRLNSMNDKLGKEYEDIGFLLKGLWDRYDCKNKCGRKCENCSEKLIVHSTKINGSKHEQDMKKNYKKVTNNSRFSRNGIYTDLLYDTYQKDWTKAYQNTFHEFFHAIDWLANPEPTKCFTSVYKNKFFRFIHLNNKSTFGFDPKEKYQFGEVIIKDIDNLKPGDFERINNLPMHDKAPLYDAIGGEHHKGKYPDKLENEELFTKIKEEERNYEQYGHTCGYWIKEGFMNEDRTRYVSTNGVLNYFDALEPVARLYMKSKNKDYGERKAREYINDNFPGGKNVNDIEEKEREALAEIARIVVFAQRAGENKPYYINDFYEHFPASLAMEVFANMAATAVVNQNAFKEMKRYLPNSYRMFKEILNCIFLKLRCSI